MTTRAGARGIPIQPDISSAAIRRGLTTSAAVLALVAAIMATAASVAASADPGIEGVVDGSYLSYVDPGGFAWRQGVRAGQRVLRVTTGDTAAEWQLVAEADGRTLVASAAGPERGLRETLPISLGAVLFAVVAAVSLRGRRGWVAPASAFALLLAIPAVALHGKSDAAAVMGAALVVPVGWLSWRRRVPLIARGTVLVLACLLLGGWLAARYLALEAYDAFDVVRDSVTFLSTLAVAVVAVGVPLVRDREIMWTRPRITDVVAVTVATGIAIGLVSVFGVPIAVVAIAFLVGVVALPALRRWIAGPAERAVLADLREHAALEAAEAERAHLARELHDVPLQQLAGVIRRLELVPEARAEADDLRSVAEQLRGLATELRPPVLDDLGLVPALEYLAETCDTERLRVRSDVIDGTGVERGSRPPSDVELAVFRIAQEAVANALQHAGASSISITGSVEPRRVRVEVADDGQGIAADAVESARRRGRLGLSSIRRRAQAIDADLQIIGPETGSARGTRVELRWER